MSSASEQIIILFKQGNSPEIIAGMLTLELQDVLLILNSTGQLTKKKLYQNKKVAAATNNSNVGGTAQQANNEDATLVIVKDDDTVDVIYQRYHKQIAQNLVSIAISDPDELIPAGVIAKAAIYINEEVTGRNEARAKKNNNSMLLNVAEMLAHARMAANRIDNILNGQDKQLSNSDTIEVESKVA